MTRLAAAALLIGAAAAAAIALNLLLLDRASGSGQIGRLQPRAPIPGATTVQPPTTTTHVDHHGGHDADD